MPTGYKEGIINGSIKTFPEFAKICMRAFGATIHMKEDRLNAEYKKRLPSDYHIQKIAEAELVIYEAKADAEKKAQEDILKEKLKLEKLSINKRLAVWIDGFVLPETSVNNETTKLIKEKFESFKKWAKIEIQK